MKRVRRAYVFSINEKTQVKQHHRTLIVTHKFVFEEQFSKDCYIAYTCNSYFAQMLTDGDAVNVTTDKYFPR